MELTLSRSHLLAALQCAATDDLRYYLNGVRVEADQAGVRYIATDGHILWCSIDESDKADEPYQVILPSDLVKQATKGGSRAPEFIKLVDEEPGRGKPLALGDQYAQPIEGSFPDWKAVVPTGAIKPALIGTFDARLLVRLRSAFLAFEGRSPADKTQPTSLAVYGNDARSPHLVSGGHDNGFAVAMPYDAKADHERRLQTVQGAITKATGLSIPQPAKPVTRSLGKTKSRRKAA